MRPNVLKQFSSFFVSLLVIHVSHAAVNFADAPVTVGNPIPPNILFIIDDSTSMDREYMPDDLDEECRETIPNMKETKVYCQSPDYNKMYYNPEFSYETPAAADGSSLGDSVFDDAWNDGYDQSGSTTNLHKWREIGPDGGSGSDDLSFFEWGRQRTGWYCDADDIKEIEISIERRGRTYTVERLVCDGAPKQITSSRNRTRRFWYVGGGIPSRYFSSSSSSASSDTSFVDPEPDWDPFDFYRYNSSVCDGSSSSYTDEDCYIQIKIDESNQQEMQNAANWFSYYRSRILTAKSGVSIAFDSLDQDYRLGYGSINNSNTIQAGLSPYSNSRTPFYNWLHNVSPSGFTELRVALDDAGDYYSGRTPYLLDLNNSNSEVLSCQQNFTVLMTDGYWNGDSAGTRDARDDNDSKDGPTITSPSGRSFKFLANTEPYDDNQDNTLADVAMYYWKRDLRTDLENNVPISERDPAFWQHMVTIGIGLGVTGDISRQEGFAAIDSGVNIDWGDPTNSDAKEEKIDDLLHAAVNSRGDFFSAKNPEEFTDGLKTALGNVQTRVASGTSPAVNSAQVSGERLLYKATYRSGDWGGSLSAYGFDPETGAIGSKQWTASFPAEVDRNIFTSILSGPNKVGSEFLWEDLDSVAQSSFGTNNNSEAELVVEYLRGDQTNEVSVGGDFRSRTNGILGDIIHSSPIFVGSPDELKYRGTSWPESSSHITFARQNAQRPPVVYVSANDGMLHAFHGETGLELFAYLPRAAMLNNISDLADPAYQHRYFNDGPISVYDVYINNQWRTILIGLLGRGGKAIYALDVADPLNFSSGDVLWEISNVDNGAVGEILSDQTIARLSDGTWVLLSGNGYNSAGDKAQLLVVDIASGQLKVLSTGVGSSVGSGNSNGLAGVLAWDSSLTADYIADEAYAGDLLGNVWKFDLSAGFNALATTQLPNKLFTATDASGDGQPLISRLEGEQDDNDNLWLFFGTGKLFDLADVSDVQVQSWYGLKIGGASSQPILKSNLKQRSLRNITNTSAYYSAVRAADEATANDMNGKDGWFIDFNISSNSTGERILVPNILRSGALVGTTYIPEASTCSPGGSGFIIAVDPFTGAALTDPYFDYNNDNKLDSNDRLTAAIISGISFGDVLSKPIFVDDQLVTQLEGGDLESVKVPAGVAGVADPLKRMSWREIRQ